MVHLKDVRANWEEENVLLGTGAARIPAAMREPCSQEFAGLVAVEYQKQDDVYQDMEKQVAFARTLA